MQAPDARRGPRRGRPLPVHGGVFESRVRRSIGRRRRRQREESPIHSERGPNWICQWPTRPDRSGSGPHAFSATHVSTAFAVTIATATPTAVLTRIFCQPRAVETARSQARRARCSGCLLNIWGRPTGAGGLGLLGGFGSLDGTAPDSYGGPIESTLKPVCPPPSGERAPWLMVLFCPQ
jgi:hypothetical protein